MSTSVTASIMPELVWTRLPSEKSGNKNWTCCFCPRQASFLTETGFLAISRWLVCLVPDGSRYPDSIKTCLIVRSFVKLHKMTFEIYNCIKKLFSYVKGHPVRYYCRCVSKPKCYGDCVFSVAGPCLWNRLLESVKCAVSLGMFKSLLKTHLLKIAFEDL